jgi:hypothetical protein
MSEELELLLEMLDEEVAKRKSLSGIPEAIEAMHLILFEAATELAPVSVATLRHIASLKLRKDGVCDYYEVSNKQIRDLFERHGKQELLPKVQKGKA